MPRRTAQVDSARGARCWAAALFAAVVAANLVACGGAEHPRPAQSRGALLAKRDAADLRSQVEHGAFVRRNLARVKAELDDYAAGRTSSPPVVDLLVVSGGGDWGAFGAGFLKGWGTVPPGAMARPEFDAVTGVSTGALIAPFAFLGDDASIEKVVRLYRNPKKDWVRSRGLMSLLNGGPSFADVPGLEREIKQALDLPTLRRIAEAGAGGRLLAVSATNVDTEEMRVWDVAAEARHAAETGKTGTVRRILLASAAIPGVFPPRQIDGALYVDGGVTGNILYSGPNARRDDDTFVARWLEEFPGVGVPKIRYWVIFNNEVRWPPEVVQPRWSSMLVKSSTASTRAATLNSIRQMFLQAEVAKSRHQADVEVRFVAVPDGWVAPRPGNFVKETMNALADLGERMGADPSSWRTAPP
jgi:predicted acylesterase/phospholipase RssA